MTFHWPQICLIAFYLLIGLVSFATNRKRSVLVGVVLMDGLIFFLLYMGGFFAGAHP